MSVPVKNHISINAHRTLSASEKNQVLKVISEATLAERVFQVGMFFLVVGIVATAATAPHAIHVPHADKTPAIVSGAIASVGFVIIAIGLVHNWVSKKPVQRTVSIDLSEPSPIPHSRPVKPTLYTKGAVSKDHESWAGRCCRKALNGALSEWIGDEQRSCCLPGLPTKSKIDLFATFCNVENQDDSIFLTTLGATFLGDEEALDVITSTYALFKENLKEASENAAKAGLQKIQKSHPDAGIEEIHLNDRGDGKVDCFILYQISDKPFRYQPVSIVIDVTSDPTKNSSVMNIFDLVESKPNPLKYFGVQNHS
jgi:hypothetical protein